MYFVVVEISFKRDLRAAKSVLFRTNFREKALVAAQSLVKEAGQDLINFLAVRCPCLN